MIRQYKRRLSGTDAASGGWNGVLIDQVGDSGWVSATLMPVPMDTSTYGLMDKSQPGSRIYLVDPELGNDSTGTVLFYDESNNQLVDQTGSATGLLGVPYGTNPQSPNLAALQPFRSWAYVAPKGSGTSVDSLGNTTTTAISTINLSPASAFRAGKPDWWLLRRGATLDLYSDLRGYFDSTSRSAQALGGSINVTLTTAGGVSSSQRAWIGAYGPLSDGRARVIRPPYSFAWRNNTVGTTWCHQGMFGLFLDSTEREFPIRPVDYTNFADPDAGLANSSVHIGNVDGTNRDFYYEDMLLLGGCADFQVPANKSHTTPVGVRGVDFDWQLHRSLIVDAYRENKFSVFNCTKGGVAQTFSANTTQAITFSTGTTADFNGTTFTVPAGWNGLAYNTSYYVAMQYLFDVTATIAADGALRVGLFVNGVETLTKTFAGTGVSSDVYKVFGVFRTPQNALGWASAATVEIRVTTTSATGTISVAGSDQGRLTCYRIAQAGAGCQGLYALFSLGSRAKVSESLILRNGFSCDPAGSGDTLPNGHFLSWNTLNHNIYTVGDADLLGVEVVDNVLLTGSAASTFRNPAIIDRNFIYEGGLSIAPEHKDRAYTTSSGNFRDNVMQIYISSGSTAHYGDSVAFSCGVYGMQITGNIVSNAQVNGLRGLTFQAQVTPYYVPDQLIWTNDVAQNTISNNILDSLGNASDYNASILEGNGTRYAFSQFLTPITIRRGGVTVAWPATAYQAGDIATCAPVTGYTGTPSYQWYRYDDTIGTTNKTAISGATSASYTLTASDIGTASNPTDPAGWSRAWCEVTGINYPAGYGIDNNTGSNNILVRPDTSADIIQFSMNGFGNVPTVANPSTVTYAPAGATTSISPDLSYSGISLTGTRRYSSLAAAKATEGGSNWNASIKTHLQGLGLNMTSADGMQEYIDNTGARSNNPKVNAMRRGLWDTRYVKGLLNHVRQGRGKTALG